MVLYGDSVTKCVICEGRTKLFQKCTQCIHYWCLECNMKIQKCPFCRLGLDVTELYIIQHFLTILEENICHYKELKTDISQQIRKHKLKLISYRLRKTEMTSNLLKTNRTDTHETLKELLDLEDDSIYTLRRVRILVFSMNDIAKTLKMLYVKRTNLLSLRQQFLILDNDKTCFVQKTRTVIQNNRNKHYYPQTIGDLGRPKIVWKDIYQLKHRENNLQKLFKKMI